MTDYPPLIELMLLTLALTDSPLFYLLPPLELSSLLILPATFLVHLYPFSITSINYYSRKNEIFKH